jgi:MFS family permease
LGTDYWKYWSSTTVSQLGSRFTQFAVPLFVYTLTGSAYDLGVATTLSFLPTLLFGLLFGAYADRVDRKRLLVYGALAKALVIASIPALAVADTLVLWWVYTAIFLHSCLMALTGPAEFAAMPNLVGRDLLTRANGYLQAGVSAARVVGPLLAGLLVTLVPIYSLLFFDALSYVAAALVLASVRAVLSAPDIADRPATSVRQDVAEGLRYLWGQPVIRNISLMIALTNFLEITIDAQLVLFAKQHLGADNFRVGLLYSVAGASIALTSLAAAPLRRRISFGRATVGALMAYGVLAVALSSTSWYWFATAVWALMMGFGILFDISSQTLTQTIVPDRLLGRVQGASRVLALSGVPLGAFLGGIVVERTGNVALVFGCIGGAIFLIAFAFSFTALGKAERYIPEEQASERA